MVLGWVMVELQVKAFSKVVFVRLGEVDDHQARHLVVVYGPVKLVEEGFCKFLTFKIRRGVKDVHGLSTLIYSLHLPLPQHKLLPRLESHKVNDIILAVPVTSGEPFLVLPFSWARFILKVKLRNKVVPQIHEQRNLLLLGSEVQPLSEPDRVPENEVVDDLVGGFLNALLVLYGYVKFVVCVQTRDLVIQRLGLTVSAIS